MTSLKKKLRVIIFEFLFAVLLLEGTGDAIHLENHLYSPGDPYTLRCNNRQPASWNILEANRYRWTKDNVTLNATSQSNNNNLELVLNNETMGVYRCHEVSDGENTLVSITYFLSGSQRFEIDSNTVSLNVSGSEEKLLFFKYKSFLPEVRYPMNCTLLEKGFIMRQDSCSLRYAKGVIHLKNFEAERGYYFQIKADTVIGTAISEPIHIKVFSFNSSKSDDDNGIVLSIPDMYSTEEAPSNLLLPVICVIVVAVLILVSFAILAAAIAVRYLRKSHSRSSTNEVNESTDIPPPSSNDIEELPIPGEQNLQFTANQFQNLVVHSSYEPQNNRTSTYSSSEVSLSSSRWDIKSCDSNTLFGDTSSWCTSTSSGSKCGVPVKTIHEGYLLSFNQNDGLGLITVIFNNLLLALKRRFILQQGKEYFLIDLNPVEITKYWTLFDPSMLEKLQEHIVTELNYKDNIQSKHPLLYMFSNHLAEILHSYKKTISNLKTCLATIESQQTAEILLSRKPQDFIPLKIKLLHEAEELPVAVILNDVKDSICTAIRIPEFLVLLAGYQRGSVILWFYIPKEAVPSEDAEVYLWEIFVDLRKRKGFKCHLIELDFDQEPSVNISYDIGNPDDMEMVAPFMRRLAVRNISYNVKPSSDAVDTSQPSLMSISNYMPRLSPKAREIGIALGRENYPNELQGYDNMLILERVIQGWITSGSRCVGDRDVTVTWDYFLSVLRSPAVDMGGIAEKIEREWLHNGRKRRPLLGGSDGEQYSSADSSSTGYGSY